MPSDDIAISVRNLTKRYRLFGHPGDRVKQFLSLGLKQYHRDFTALEDVSFDIRRGETVGIIGRNGSGKSTLLQLICGILKPTAGTVQVNGRVAALLELGAGFNPEFTGRENVYFQGALMGLDKGRMDERFEAIAAFADIGEFIDQPVRTYSSGMFVRLAFATMIHVDANILVIDEAIAVGDAGFRARCFRRLGELGATGCTILFVTHAMEQVTRFCGRALLLDHGRVAMQGTPAPVVAECLRLQAVLPENDAGTEATAGAYAPNGAQIEAVQLTDAGGQEAFPLCSGLDYRCRFRARLDRPAVDVRGAFLIRTETGAELGGGMTPRIESLLGGATVEVELSFVCRLNPGTYRLDIALFAREGGIEFALHGIRNALPFKVVRRDDQASLGAVDFECRATINRMTTELA
jgi:ABC-type polysaccharide/polyol phosphate transport system ATPase subunit